MDTSAASTQRLSVTSIVVSVIELLLSFVGAVIVITGFTSSRLLIFTVNCSEYVHPLPSSVCSLIE